MSKSKSKRPPKAIIEWQLLANMAGWVTEKTKSTPESVDGDPQVFTAVDIDAKASLHMIRGDQPAMAALVGTEHRFTLNWYGLVTHPDLLSGSPLTVGVFDIDGNLLFEFKVDDPTQSLTPFADLLIQHGVDRQDLGEFFDAPRAAHLEARVH
jgi:hypothetical protein